MVKPVSVKPQEPNNSISTPEYAAKGAVDAVRTIAQLAQARCNIVGFLSTVDLRAFLSTSRDASSGKSELIQEHVHALVKAIDTEILRFAYSKTTSKVLNDISQRALGTDFSQKTPAQKTELFHQVLVLWEGAPSTKVAVSIEAVRLCDQLFPPDSTASGFPMRQLDHLPKSRQPRVANYSKYGGFEGDVQVQTQKSIREAVQHKVHVLFT